MSASKILAFPQYLTPQQAADYLGMSKSFLDKARVHGDGPPYFKIGNRVRYRRDELDAWMEAHRMSNTSEYGSQQAA